MNRTVYEAYMDIYPVINGWLTIINKSLYKKQLINIYFYINQPLRFSVNKPQDSYFY